MRRIVARVHASDRKIVGATILPMCNAAGGPKEQARLAVDQWIRTPGRFDAVLRDPADPTVIRADRRTDCYHPDAEGDRRLGESIDLAVFDRLPAEIPCCNCRNVLFFRQDRSNG